MAKAPVIAPAPVKAPDARTHALTIASATHLHRAGHLPEVTKSRIHAKARAALNGMRKGAPARPVQAFGSLAPDVDQDQQ